MWVHLASSVASFAPIGSGACLQVGPPSLRRVRISASVRGERSISTLGKQQAGLRLQFEKKASAWEYWPGQRQTASTEELAVAVRVFAEARGIAVTLEDDGRCVMFERT